ncbi:hypothetical protein [Cellulomonas fengjieae]|uniref:AbiEi antitoxin C-terminal domain-containing protein n=1 Tax=Cellulomonas fengjieae TaxID=2819978 RepID=A0ABS3SKJ9_9CELL|nr:hypothetical protein [Cellulomonas fengjieae]MBO3085505.1 hypothetical protein [Cellulomonas fengjieae]MBO3102613.1 hypothetical protein [Cellulomonas fengjieae]QVI64451.1 hypothetical protein KG102_09530 [Cellulomonas fengjieae]
MSTRLDAYRAVPPVLPRTVTRDDVGAAAWFGLLRDGVVRVVWGDVAIAADLPDTPELRTLALAPLVPARGVIGRRTAAWVHTGLFPPVRVEVLVRTGGRRTDPHPERVAAEATLAPEDVVRVGGHQVTSVQRTGLDLARMLPYPEAVPLLRALQGVGLDPTRALASLDAFRGQRGVRRAQSTLRGL